MTTKPGSVSNQICESVAKRTCLQWLHLGATSAPNTGLVLARNLLVHLTSVPLIYLSASRRFIRTTRSWWTQLNLQGRFTMIFLFFASMLGSYLSRSDEIFCILHENYVNPEYFNLWNSKNFVCSVQMWKWHQNRPTIWSFLHFWWRFLHSDLWIEKNEGQERNIKFLSWTGY